MKTELLAIITLLFCASCQPGKNKKEAAADEHGTYMNPLLDAGAEPWATYYNGKYYYTQGTESEISLWVTSDITDLRNAEHKVIYVPKGHKCRFHLWAPEIHRIDGKWYIYYTADDGNTDNHQIYVAENESEDPMQGSFQFKGHIPTDADHNWAIHASTFVHQGKRYMIWSGWQKKKTDIETQCIYIAAMENPWTLSSERVLISKPEYEWERQWISPDGSKTAYAIYVNENPQAFFSKTGDKVFIYYGASGGWTPYYCVGMLSANADDDFLNPASWHKKESPVFMQNPKDSVFGPGGVSFVPSPDGQEWYMLYHARQIPNDAAGAIDSRTPRIQKITWDAQGIPRLGTPDRTGMPLPKPSCK